jgi:hypothetical protein
MIIEILCRKDMEGYGHGLILNTAKTLVWRDGEKMHETCQDSWSPG